MFDFKTVLVTSLCVTLFAVTAPLKGQAMSIELSSSACSQAYGTFQKGDIFNFGEASFAIDLAVTDLNENVVQNPVSLAQHPVSQAQIDFLHGVRSKWLAYKVEHEGHFIIRGAFAQSLQGCEIGPMDKIPFTDVPKEIIVALIASVQHEDEYFEHDYDQRVDKLTSMSLRDLAGRLAELVKAVR